ncbi:hypothetical protein [Haloarchaeobius sp. TZWWS8]|uniref:hypothetical protein n=1 Tax=Haloarchaeobius sp. TZWWS8 TaxID=3446121 RepID=UPI003EBE9577
MTDDTSTGTDDTGTGTDNTGTVAARKHLQRTHADLFDAVWDCADAVAESWDDEPSQREAVVVPFTALLRKRDLLTRLPAVLADAVDAAGYELAAEPVAAPPYVVVTSTGPVCRATVSEGRLVVSLNCFDIDRGADGVRYVRRSGDARTALEISLIA